MFLVLAWALKLLRLAEKKEKGFYSTDSIFFYFRYYLILVRYFKHPQHSRRALPFTGPDGLGPLVWLPYPSRAVGWKKKDLPCRAINRSTNREERPSRVLCSRAGEQTAERASHCPAAAGGTVTASCEDG